MKAEERRKQILDCATSLFAEHGYHRTTVEHIVKRAGVARGTFYSYFKDKRSIFDELLERFIADLRTRISRIEHSVSAPDSLAIMHQNFQRVVALCLENRALTKILLSEAVGLDPDLDEKLLEFYRTVTQLMETALVLGQERGLVREGDAYVIATFVVGSLKELLYRVTMGGTEIDPAPLIEALLNTFLYGLFVGPDR